jgi:superfamily II DNA or RNA helicase
MRSFLSEVAVEDEYRSDTVDVERVLLEPLLRRCARFDRAASGSLDRVLPFLARGLEGLAEGGGFLRLLVQMPVEPGGGDEHGRLLDRVDEALGSLETSPPAPSRGFTALSELLTTDHAQVFVCGGEPGAVGVEAVAIFAAGEGESAVAVGWRDDADAFEVLDVFTSWGPSADRVYRKRGAFERTLEGGDRGLVVTQLDKGRMGRLLAIAAELSTPTPQRDGSATSPGQAELVSPSGLVLRGYQVEAIRRWHEAGRRGVMAMATGSGKTIVGMAAAARLRAEDPSHPLLLVVLAPLIHLVDQWCAEVRRWGERPIACYESSSSWLPGAQEAIDLLRAGARRTVVLVSTHATASLDPFKRLLARAPDGSVMLVGDEVHHLGAAWARDALPATAGARIGLSATPERSEDEGGNDFLFGYFGDVVYRFGIAEAIAARCLSPYAYHPVLVELDREELDDYRRVAGKLNRMLQVPADRRDRAVLAQLLNERSRILNNARGKLAVLRRAVEARRPDRAIVYCAGRDQLSAVMDIMWERGITSRQFTGEEPRGEREALLAGLDKGEVPALVGIRCLDEGVDVPGAREAYLLASSGNPREFVQRRGRLLRTAPGKIRSDIHDLVTVPTDPDGSADALLVKELRRVLAFAADADNGEEALALLQEQLSSFGFSTDLGGS